MVGWGRVVRFSGDTSHCIYNSHGVARYPLTPMAVQSMIRALTV